MPAQLIQIVIAVVAVAVFIGLNALVLVYLERKLAGHFQRRPGPFEVGPHGVIQPLADALKLIGKQLFTPDGADKFIFWLAPMVSFVPVVVLFIPLPFSPLLTGWEANLGIVLILAFAGLNVLALALAGWGQHNKYGLLGAARAVCQSVGYEIPLLLSLLAVAFMEGSLNFSTIVEAQGPWPCSGTRPFNRWPSSSFSPAPWPRPTARPSTSPKASPNSRPGSTQNIPAWASASSSWPNTRK